MPASRTSKTSTVAAAKKTAAKKPAAKKPKTKKAATPAVDKVAKPKKAASKKAPAKKTVAKKAPATKKAATKKAAAKKAPATKKAATKKPATKKPAAKKPAAKKTTPTAKKATSKSTATAASSTKASPTVTPPKSASKTKKKPVATKVPDYLTDKAWLKSQRAILVDERARYTKSAKSLADEAAQLMADREPGDVQFDEESGEGDTIAVERDRDLALSAKAREAVDNIDAAFVRLDKGTYGFCTAGVDYIPKERLEAIPEASVCVQHKTAMF